jgi:hypothetical protein
VCLISMVSHVSCKGLPSKRFFIRILLSFRYPNLHEIVPSEAATPFHSRAQSLAFVACSQFSEPSLRPSSLSFHPVAVIPGFCVLWTDCNEQLLLTCGRTP